MKKLNTMLEDKLSAPLSDSAPRGRQKRFPISHVTALVFSASLLLTAQARADGTYSDNQGNFNAFFGTNSPIFVFTLGSIPNGGSAGGSAAAGLDWLDRKSVVEGK